MTWAQGPSLQVFYDYEDYMERRTFELEEVVVA